MNLIYGKLADYRESLAALDGIGDAICRTLSAGRLDVERVIAACDELSYQLSEEEHIPALLALGLTAHKARGELRQAKAMLCREYLEARLKNELQEIPKGSSRFVPHGGTGSVTQAWRPLGVLLHIAAGNVDALPAFSVIEGLLTGNVNILKLPGDDGGLSTGLLRELIRIEPCLAGYVYVFDYPSTDVASMKKMADVAHAIVVWGGDDAVCAVRRMARPNTKIIEWGHKISFAFVSGEDVSDQALKGIAHNICETEQLFCSACQGIYLDVQDEEQLFRFAERFASILDGVAASQARKLPPALQAQKTLELYTEQLESVSSDKRVYQSENCSVIASLDGRLEASYMFRNCWVKPLPRHLVLGTLLMHKNHLQTVALLCPDARRAELTELLLSAGVVRVTDGFHMSRQYCEMPHDGEFALRRYMKRVSIEYIGNE